MNGIGITQWQDNQTDYPLKQAGNLGGIFCDASFVMYDSFIPVLTGIVVSDGYITLSFQFDDGIQSFICATSSVVSGYVFRLKTSKRNYGLVVFGRLIADVIAGTYGNSITTNISFETITVRSIDSTNGVYSINDIDSNVSIVMDSNIWFDSSHTFNAISVPSNLVTIETSPAKLYLTSSALRLIEMDLVNNTSTVVTALDKVYPSVVNTGTTLIAVSVSGNASSPTTTISELKNIPAPILNSSLTNFAATCAVYTGVLLLFSFPANGSPIVYELPTYPYNSTVNNYTIDNSYVSVVYFGGSYYAIVNGSLDYSSLTNFSSSIYKLSLSGNAFTSTLIGTLVSPGNNNHMPNLTSLTSTNGNLYGIGTDNVIYNINTSTLIMTPVMTYAGDGTTETILGMFGGGISIAISPVTALKSINSTRSLYNGFNDFKLMGGSSLTITSSNSDTLVFSLPVPDANLNVVRSQHYV